MFVVVLQDAAYAFDTAFSLARFLVTEDFEEDGEKELLDSFSDALASFVSALLESEVTQVINSLLCYTIISALNVVAYNKELE